MLRNGLAFALSVTLGVGCAQAQTQPRTLNDALAAAYSNNPTLQAARAQLRAVDEGVAQAVAGWRPTVVLSGTAGYADGTFRVPFQGVDTVSRNNRNTSSVQAVLTQPLYRGGNTRATTNQANNQVFAQRGRLLSSEQQLFTDTINAFVGVIQAQQVLQLNISNEQVLGRQLQATNDRFRVGEITRTDVAQAEAALSGARATASERRQGIKIAAGAVERVLAGTNRLGVTARRGQCKTVVPHRDRGLVVDLERAVAIRLP